MNHGRESAIAALIEALATATAECTALMDEQFRALIARDPEIARFDQKIAKALEKRKLDMESLREHIQLLGPVTPSPAE